MVISIFAIIILSVLGALFRSGHHEFVGGTEDPKDGPAVASTIFIAVLVYAVGFVQRLRLDQSLCRTAMLIAFSHRASSSSAVSRACCISAKAEGAPSLYEENGLRCK